MSSTGKLSSIIGLTLLAAFPAHAASCAQSIVAVQARLDAAIERRAGSDGSKPESLNALRGHQPTPWSIAATESERGRQFEAALDSLDRARSADRSGYVDVCRRQVAYARAALRR